MKKAIVFDMDGVLFDSEPVYLKRSQEFLAHLGYNATIEHLSQNIGKSTESWRKLIGEIIGEDISYADYKEQHDAYFKGNPVNYGEVINPDLKPLLKWLKERNIPIGLASNSPMEDIEYALLSTGVIDYFNVIASGKDRERAKPAPDVYLYVCERLGQKPEDCLVLEDSPSGITAAKAAGIGVVLGKKDDRYSLDQSAADRIVKSISVAKEYFA